MKLITDEDIDAATAKLAKDFENYPNLDFSFVDDYRTETRWIIESILNNKCLACKKYHQKRLEEIANELGEMAQNIKA